MQLAFFALRYVSGLVETDASIIIFSLSFFLKKLAIPARDDRESCHFGLLKLSIPPKNDLNIE